jgi:hypothetical protein
MIDIVLKTMIALYELMQTGKGLPWSSPSICFNMAEGYLLCVVRLLKREVRNPSQEAACVGARSKCLIIMKSMSFQPTEARSG